jgi:hypothetical protein
MGMLDRKHDHSDLNELLHPAQAFEHPAEVVNDPDLTLNEKRAIPASWASDACSIEANPALRYLPGSRRAVSIDDVLDALRDLDKEARGEASPQAWMRRQVRRRQVDVFRRRGRAGRGSGQPLSH